MFRLIWKEYIHGRAMMGDFKTRKLLEEYNDGKRSSLLEHFVSVL